MMENCHSGDIICSESDLVEGERLIAVVLGGKTFDDDDKKPKDEPREGSAEHALLGDGDHAGGSDPLLKIRSVTTTYRRSLLAAFQDIFGMADQLNLPEVIVERGHTLFKQLQPLHNHPGRNN